MTGVLPSESGVYMNPQPWRPQMPDTATIPQHFMAHGYRTEGAGKIFHHQRGGAFHDEKSFHRFLMMPDPPDAPMPTAKLNGLGWYGSPNTDWGPWPGDEATHGDVRTVRIRHGNCKPFEPRRNSVCECAWQCRIPVSGVVAVSRHRC